MWITWPPHTTVAHSGSVSPHGIFTVREWGRAFFLRESLAYQSSQYPYWLIMLVPTRRWPILLLLPPSSSLVLPSHCYHQADRKNWQMVKRFLAAFWTSCQIFITNASVFWIWVKMNFKWRCLHIFCMHPYTAWNPTTCAHDQAKKPKKLTVSLLMSPGRSPVLVC